MTEMHLGTTSYELVYIQFNVNKPKKCHVHVGREIAFSVLKLNLHYFSSHIQCCYVLALLPTCIYSDINWVDFSERNLLPLLLLFK